MAQAPADLKTSIKEGQGKKKSVRIASSSSESSEEEEVEKKNKRRESQKPLVTSESKRSNQSKKSFAGSTKNTKISQEASKEKPKA